MKRYKTILDLICDTAKWNGGTIHQALEYFKKLTLTEQTAIYFACVSCDLQNCAGFYYIEDTVKAGNVQRFNGMAASCGTR